MKVNASQSARQHHVNHDNLYYFSIKSLMNKHTKLMLTLLSVLPGRADQPAEVSEDQVRTA